MRASPSRVVACLALISVLVLGVARPGLAADPLAKKRREAARLRAQLDATDQRLSILAEDFDEATVRLAAARRRSAATNTAHGTAVELLARVEERARRRVLYAYEHPRSVISTTDDLSDVAKRRGYTELARRTDADVLDELRAARAELADRSRAARRAATRATQLEATVKTRRDEASRLIAQQEKLLRRVEGDLKVLIEKDRAARALAEERRARQVIADAERRATDAARKRTDELATQRAAEASSRRSARDAALASADRRSSRRDPTDVGPAPGVFPDIPTSPGVSRVLALARAQVGKPYVWGAGGPGSFDCSGLTSFAWRGGGVSLPHSSRAQYAATARVRVSDIRPGDLVFYGSPIHHVGIYVGGGLMVEASHRGAPVRVRPIFRRDLVGVGRVR